MTSPLRIATRRSELALHQARLVQRALAERGTESELVTYTTIGDRQSDRPLTEIGGKGVFTKELEDDLLAGRVDCAVHSLKDLPALPNDGVLVAAILPREDARDAVVVRPGLPPRLAGLDELPDGTRVGTSSLRRRALLRLTRPDLDVVELRGNVPTRVARVSAGEMDAAVLAVAGLVRLGLQERIALYLDAPTWLPAPGQGAIAVQTRADDTRWRALVEALDHAPTRAATTAERALLAALEGGCQVPIGALVLPEAGNLRLFGMVADVDGRRVVRGNVEVNSADPAAAGEALAEKLLEGGARDLLATVRAAAQIPRPQPT